MGKFFEALQRESVPLATSADAPAAVRPVKLSLVPAAQTVPAALGREEEIYHLAEQVSAIASISEASRLFVAACAPGDGASSVAVAIALNLSQHLGVSTALVDAHLQHPGLQNFFPREDAGKADLRGSLAVRGAGLPRLDVVMNSLGQTAEQLMEEIETTLPSYRAAVIDLGVVRLEPSLLKLVKPNDLVLLVARYGHTERRHLLASARAFSAANRPAAGVIFNAMRNPIPEWIRRIVRIGG
jgi:Mrp family chromosome partitioning ATPase